MSTAGPPQGARTAGEAEGIPVTTTRQGPLAGIRVLEFAGIGPGPMCGMLLADMGAEVLLLERRTPADIGLPRPRRYELVHRGKRSLAVDLKRPEGVALALDLAASADVLLEGFRPGVMERLGLGPEACLARRPALVYGRITGFGQSGPLRDAAGHDLNYIALSGALHAIGRAGQPPTPPLNLLGDYAGGALSLAFGIASALVERAASGRGQVVDAAMVEGAALLMAPVFGLQAAGLHGAERGSNLLDSGAPHYEVYRCADGEYVAFGAIERKFRAAFAERAGLPAGSLDALDDPATWPQARERLVALFATRTQAGWCALLEGSDACVTPVLPTARMASHAHLAARGVVQQHGGVAQPAPAPRLSRTPGAIDGLPPAPGAGGAALARAWGMAPARLQALEADGVLGRAEAEEKEES